MQLTMEPLPEIIQHAQTMDRAGFDTMWLAEAYPWWRKHSMEARSATALAPILARETERLAVAWGIISPYTRHPLQVAMEARVAQEAAGPGRFMVGLGASKIFMKAAGIEDERPARPRTNLLESLEIIRAVLAGEAVDLVGKEWTARAPALKADAEAPDWPVPLYMAGTGPKMQQSAGEVAAGLLTPSITTPAFVRYAAENVRIGAERAGRDPGDVDIGCTIVASIDEDPARGREGAREIAGMYLANKVQNIQGSADVLLDKAELTQEEIRPVADAMEEGGRLAAKEAVTDEVLDKTKAIAGTPAECIERIREYREAGCSHIMLELWGEDRNRQLRMFGEQVLPHVGQGEPV
ncbi:LLM class flavin-dependent oxidoreductase [Egibacter rhizosphaerae]|uniref:LLM class flavin-dependent oxidoreductase n=2 Tax=Egibacter rhizosphaerae TaxID=1670831 RepID=A0A411YLG8_9ACTN|nr:LLM class flavin-dependent oxidoreductase [Egibacter rhizosphaerae]